MNSQNLGTAERAILYDIILPGSSRREAEMRLAEAESLVGTLGGIVLLKVIQRRHHAGSTSFIGLGKLQEIGQISRELGATAVIINAPLKSKQIYNIQEHFESIKYKCKVWDRVEVILNIFSRHARTSEAKLQLELARVRHMGPRIYGMGHELSNQGGGIGTRGIGETNTEIMKRHLAGYRRQIETKIENMGRTRRLGRERREKLGFKTVSIVGYTNAGKSHLFRSLSRKEVLVENALFATLDTTTAELYTPSIKQRILLTDTIGFISDLPMELVTAFKSTLEETLNADLLLHVVDVSDPDMYLKISTVNEVLSSLGAAGKPMLYVFNKIDLLSPSFDKSNLTRFNPVYISAKNKENLSELMTFLCNTFAGEKIPQKEFISADEEQEPVY